MKSKKKILIIAFSILILLALSGPSFFYAFGFTSDFSRRILAFLPYPIVLVQGRPITTAKLFDDVEAVKNFYQSQDLSSVGMRIDFSTDLGKKKLMIKEKDILDKLVENEIIMAEAKKRGIRVTKKEADAVIQKTIAQSGDEQTFKLNLKKTYGWQLAEFRDKVVLPQIFLEKLSQYYTEKEPDSQKGLAEIHQAKKALLSNGSNFQNVAQEFSQGDSQQNSGQLGWWKKEQLVPEVAESAFSLPKGALSEIITSNLGYHLIQVQDIREVQDEKNQEKSKEVKLQQIFIRSGSFFDWIIQKKKEASVRFLTRKYIWSKEKGQVIFRTSSLREAEDQLRVRSEGDPTLQ